MYEKDGQRYFVVDSCVRWWDARPSNQANRHGERYVGCCYDHHRTRSPAREVRSLEEFRWRSEACLRHDLFEAGHVDVAILQPASLADLFVTGFATTERIGPLAGRHPGRFVVTGRWDPRDGEAGLDRLEDMAQRWDLRGVTLCTAERRGASKGWRLSDPWALRYLERCQELGIRNVHVHKGLGGAAFDVADVDDAASAFPELTFVVEHAGLPRLADFCWIAAKEPNVYGGLSFVLPFLHDRPRYFAEIIGELLYWIGADRITFGSDYGIWTPGWLVERFVDFQIPADMTEYPRLTPLTKRKILGLNAARLYDIEVPVNACRPEVVTR